MRQGAVPAVLGPCATTSPVTVYAEVRVLVATQVPILLRAVAVKVVVAPGAD
jgi:hypothetical protein